MTPPDDDSLLLAYVYGELSDEEARAFEARLAADRGLRAEVDGLLATRELLGQDARFGEVSGVDLPPPHLQEAILRAEVLARPTEVRQAHASTGQGGFLARIQLWLVGGGLVVGAAAALLLVLKDDAPPGAYVSDAVAEGPAARAPEQKPEPKPEQKPEPVPEPTPELAPAQEPLPMATGTTRSARGTLEGAPAEAKEERPAQAARERSAVDEVRVGSESHLGALGAGDAEAYADSAGAKEEPDTKPTPQRRAEATPPSPAASRGGAAARLDVAEAEATAAEDTQGPPSARSSRDRERAGKGGFAALESAPPGPPPLPEAARRVVAEQRKKRSRAPARAKPEGAAAKSSLSEALEMSLLTAERELQEGRPLEALDLFSAVAQRDPRGALTGVVPYVGQMRALQALSRHREVLALLPTVKRPGIRVRGVPEGILVAARSAEALGDLDDARSLYRELLVVKEQRKEAEAALERLNAAAALRMQAAEEPASAASPED